MRRLEKVTKAKLWPFLTLIILASMLSCDNEDEPSVPDQEYDITLNTTAFGNVLSASNGMTLYFFTRDVAGASECNGGCVTNWPPLLAENFTVEPGLDQTLFSTITRDDGNDQVTYKGWPLYFFANDNAAGDVNGEDVGGAWYVAKPDYDILLAAQEVNGAVSRYLVDSFGQSLYTFTNDDPNVSNCSGGCLNAWPIYGEIDLEIPSILNGGDFASISTEGNTHTTYQNQPLYYFNNDASRGDVNGHEVNNVWFLRAIQ